MAQLLVGRQTDANGDANEGIISLPAPGTRLDDGNLASVKVDDGRASAIPVVSKVFQHSLRRAVVVFTGPATGIHKIVKLRVLLERIAYAEG